MKYAIDEFSKTSDFNLQEWPKLVKQLRAMCKEGKEALSFSTSSYDIHVNSNN